MLRFTPVRSAHPNQPEPRPRSSRLARSTVFALAFLCTAFLGTAVAHAEEEPEAACPPATETTAECLSVFVPEGAFPSYQGSGEKGGFARKDLLSAYKLPSTGGSTQTIAIVDAFDDPNAESDLKTYRSHYGLSECTTANGCFSKVNQKGEAKNYPTANSGWSLEISLDVDMVSAICPECHILLVESTTNSFENMAAAVDEAATLKATEISNSWGGGDIAARVAEDSHYNHAGIPVLVAAGDSGYGAEFPASAPTVISVGGTKLETAKTSREWSETVWSGTNSGCSPVQSKPTWQTDAGCAKRTDNDIAAVAAPETPLSVYDSYVYSGWVLVGGTSASTPIMAGVEALSSSTVRSLGAEAFWKAGPSGAFFDVTEGSNGSCGGSYLCTAQVGYDGPTGWGTPNGVISVAPSATTGSTTGITKTEATLHGTVNPNGFETKYYFEYGLTTGYGTKTAETSAGSGTSNVEESQSISGLEVGTTYHFRIVASSTGGTTKGTDHTFTTTANPPENTGLPVPSPSTPDQAVPESTTTGTWTNKPTSYTYEWQLCNGSGGECANISGATKSTYTPVEGDVEHTLVVKVTASNSGGSNSAFSKATAKVKPIGQITEYALPSESYLYGITAGPDGNVWFTENGSSPKVAKITTSGTVTGYTSKGGNQYYITTGPDGNLWFTELILNKIAKITPSGTITEYSLPEGSYPYGITAGPDGNLWFTDSKSHKVGKISTSGAITEYSVPEATAGPWGIVAGPDGNLWFGLSGKIGKITTSGTVTEYSLPSGSEPEAITAGSDNNLWFTNHHSALGTAEIGKITTTGTITEYSLPSGSRPTAITAGSDGNLWFTEQETSKLGRISTAGTVTEYSLPAGSRPWRITVGPDSNIWYTNVGTSKVGKITP